MLGWRIEAIVDDSSGYTKTVEDVILDKLDHIWCLYFFQGDNFRPFREVIYYGQYEAMSSGCWRADISNHIHFSHIKWAWRGCWMKMSWCLMDKVIVDLTCMTSLSIGDVVRDHLWPKITKSSELVFELGSGLVSLAYTTLSFPECLLYLFVRKTVE